MESEPIRLGKGCVIIMPDNISERPQNARSAKIGVVGDKDSILCFKAFGLDIFPVVESEPEESRKVVDSLARNEYGIIFITEQIAQTISETINRYNSQIQPAIIPIPGNKGSLGIGLARIQSNVEKAVGINILDEGR